MSHPSRPWPAALLAAAVMLLLAACGSTGSAPQAQPPNPTTSTSSTPATPSPSPTPTPSDTAETFPVTVKAANGAVRLPTRPERIVSLSPTATEMLFAVEAGPQVEAVDDQSDYPPQAPRTKLSGFKPNVEAIAAAEPDLVLVSNDTGGLVAALGRLKVPVLLLPAATTLDDSYRQLEQIGVATGHVAEAAGVVAQMQQGIAAAVAAAPKRPDLSVYHELDPSGYSATSKTFIGAVYQQFGLRNIADQAPAAAGDYPQLSAEFVVSADPDLIMLADTRCCGQSAKTVAARPGWPAIAAVQNKGVVALDDDVASRWGPRVVQLARQVGAAVAAVPARATAAS